MSACGDDRRAAGASLQQFAFQVSECQAGVRLDQFLVQHLQDVSRSQLASSIRAGVIVVEGKGRKSGYRLKAGETVSGHLAPSPLPDLTPEEMPLTLLYEDEFLLVLSKPPGLVVHPGSGNQTGTLVHGLLHHYGMIAEVGEHARPGLVHRLDKDTSGAMVIAKREDVHRRLVEAFKTRSVEKEYLALLEGVPAQKQGRLVAPIGRHPIQRQKMAVREEGGRYAATNWRVVREIQGRYCLVAVGIETGRTHQIRVHMAHLGYPVAGDTVYGRGRRNIFPRQLLHSYRLRFAHPITGDILDIEAPLWPDFVDVLHQLEQTAAAQG